MRYIDADLLIEELKELQKLHSPSLAKTTNEAIDLGLSLAMRISRKIPTADVVEVVRCKDCKHYTSKGTCACDQWLFDDVNIDVMLNDFCSYGERRETK